MSDSIGGNAKTQMIVNVSPAEYNYAETQNSLVYASRVKKVCNRCVCMCVLHRCLPSSAIVFPLHLFLVYGMLLLWRSEKNVESAKIKQLRAKLSRLEGNNH